MGTTIFWKILPYLIAMFAWVVHKRISESDDPKETALELGQVFANITRSNLRDE